MAKLGQKTVRDARPLRDAADEELNTDIPALRSRVAAGNDGPPLAVNASRGYEQPPCKAEPARASDPSARAETLVCFDAKPPF